MQPERKVGLFLATLFVAGSMIGSGIFLLPASLAQFGSMTIFGWLAVTAGALVIARVLGHLGREYPQPGGACTYVGRILGPQWGFQATATYWMAVWTGNIAIALAAAGYLASLLPAGWSRPWPLAFVALILIWLATLAQGLGPRRVCQIDSASLFVGVIPVLLVIAVSGKAFHATIFAQSWNVTGLPAWRGLPPSLVLMFWGFMGLESASIATAIVRDPERNVARATYGGVGLAAIIYIVACGSLMGILPAATLAHSTAPFADAMASVLGRGMGALIAILALVKVLGSLIGWMLLATQTSEAGAAHGAMPALFRGRWGLIVAASLMSLGVVATVTPSLAEQFGEVIAVSVILTMLLYIYASFAAFRTRGRHDRVFAAMTMALCAVVILTSGTRLLVWSAIVVGCTLPLYPFGRTAQMEFTDHQS